MAPNRECVFFDFCALFGTLRVCIELTFSSTSASTKILLRWFSRCCASSWLLLMFCIDHIDKRFSALCTCWLIIDKATHRINLIQCGAKHTMTMVASSWVQKFFGIRWVKWHFSVSMWSKRFSIFWSSYHGNIFFINSRKSFLSNWSGYDLSNLSNNVWTLVCCDNCIWSCSVFAMISDQVWLHWFAIFLFSIQQSLSTISYIMSADLKRSAFQWYEAIPLKQRRIVEGYLFRIRSECPSTVHNHSQTISILVSLYQFTMAEKWKCLGSPNVSLNKDGNEAKIGTKPLFQFVRLSATNQCLQPINDDNTWQSTKLQGVVPNPVCLDRLWSTPIWVRFTHGTFVYSISVAAENQCLDLLRTFAYSFFHRLRCSVWGIQTFCHIKLKFYMTSDGNRGIWFQWD